MMAKKNKKIIIAGPCAIETKSQFLKHWKRYINMQMLLDVVHGKRGLLQIVIRGKEKNL